MWSQRIWRSFRAVGRSAFFSDHVNKAHDSLLNPLRKSRFASFRFQSCSSPYFGRVFCRRAGCIFLVPFYLLILAALFKRNIAPIRVILCFKFCVFLNAFNPTCLTFKRLSVKHLIGNLMREPASWKPLFTHYWNNMTSTWIITPLPTQNTLTDSSSSALIEFLCQDTCILAVLYTV